MSKLLDICTAILLEIIGWSALPLAPIAVLFAAKDSTLSTDSYGIGPAVQRANLPWCFKWLETFDERLPGGFYEPAVRDTYDRFGWYCCAVTWLWRNRAFTLAKVFAVPTTTYQDTLWRKDWTWSIFRGTVGWKVYRANPLRTPTDLIAIPSFSIRFNRKT